jgi:hypothetical protein
MAIDVPVHQLVADLAELLAPRDVKTQGIEGGPPAAFARASNRPGVVLFAGFAGAVVENPNGGRWQVLYVDLALTEWVLIEEEGIVQYAKVKDEAVPEDFDEGTRDLLWVKADTSVGRGPASQSVESQFLTGPFTRAGDFEAPLMGGTLGAATGVFCEARTPSCCRYYSRPRP